MSDFPQNQWSNQSMVLRLEDNITKGLAKDNIKNYLVRK